MGVIASFRSKPLAIAVLSALAITACSAGSDGGSIATPEKTSTTKAPPIEDTVPLVKGPVTGQNAPWTATTDSTRLPAAGYEEAEYFLDGTATSYQRKGTWGKNGEWGATPDTTAKYRTRILVRRPTNPAKFNGTVVVEWFNVSAGFETAPDYLFMQQELLRRGYAWVGVSAQAAGINGTGTGVAGLKPLRQSDPERYDTLHHPGDRYSYDIYTQTARAIRTPGSVDVLDGLEAKQIIANGESQSAFRMVTYINAIQPLAGAYDGFLVHSRFSAATPLAEEDGIDPARIRTDQEVPVLVVESESDVLGHFAARQPDSKYYRLWEMAGTSHVDASTFADALGCDKPSNSGPARFIMRAALAALTAWVKDTDNAPERAPRIEIDRTDRTVERDPNGNALGGIRTPQLDVPLATLSGEGNTGGNFCRLAGTTSPFDAATLGALYLDRDDYLERFLIDTEIARSTDYILGADGPEMVAEARKLAADAPFDS